MSELFRTGKRVDKIQIGGCLNTLGRSGLIREYPVGMFRRRELTSAEQQEYDFSPPDEDEMAEIPTSLFDRLTTAASALRAQADMLDSMALELSNQPSSDDLENLRALKDLLGKMSK